jgi:pyridoxal phosphate enzyme (YggS family)
VTVSTDIAENLARIQQRIANACTRVRREPNEICLMAVSKGHPPSRVAEAAELGLTLFGESRIQEAKAKIAQCHSRLHWQFIGHLQTNKCRDAVELFELIQSVDSLHLARDIEKAADRAAKHVSVLLEVNIAGESSKFGWHPDRLLAEIGEVNALTRIEIHGLMTIAPYATDPEKVRPVFRQLAVLRRDCEAKLGAPLPILSMGMTADLEVAIEEGATMVRVGTALFGNRTFQGTKRTEAGF